MTEFIPYDPNDPPIEGIPADPLPAMFDEGDEEETLDADSWCSSDPTFGERLRYRLRSGMKVDRG